MQARRAVRQRRGIDAARLVPSPPRLIRTGPNPPLIPIAKLRRPNSKEV